MFGALFFTDADPAVQSPGGLPGLGTGLLLHGRGDPSPAPIVRGDRPLPLPDIGRA